MKIALIIVAIVAIVAIAGSMIYYFVFFRPGIEQAELKLKEQKLGLTTAVETTTETAKKKAEYNIGDTGPAGGIIFYVNPNYEADGWRYLEAAPASQITSKKWCDMSCGTTGAAATAIGTGKVNTQTILKAQGEGDYAARLCRSLIEGGYGDWFLPSKDELNEIYVNLYLKGFDSFEGGYYGGLYWSSSESLQYSANLAWAQNFTDGRQGTTDKFNYDLWVNAVRAF